MCGERHQCQPENPAFDELVYPEKSGSRENAFWGDIMSLVLSKRDLIFCEKALMSEVATFRHMMKLSIGINRENLKRLEQHYLNTHEKIVEQIKKMDLEVAE